MFELGRTLLAAVARDPEAIAIVDGAQRLSYRDWVARIAAVVVGLSELGVRRGDHLVAVLQNRWEMATLHWACQLAGVVITPLNWRATADELDYVLTDAGAIALVYESVSSAAAREAPAAAGTTRVWVGEFSRGETLGPSGSPVPFAQLLAAAPGELIPTAEPDDTSVMLYTSGTTGRGKGVPRSHRAERAAALAHVAQNLYAFGESTLGVMPLYHTMGVRSLLSMACINGCFVCLPRFDVPDALALIESERVTTLYLVPTLFHDLIHHETFEPSSIKSVRKLGFAGAPMTQGLLNEVERAFEPELFVNHYGSSEIYTFTIEQNAAGKPGSAGRAGLNQEIRVVLLGSADPHAHAPVGEEGQIIARLDGDEAFAGYWRRPDADEKALHGGWYFTGDTGYFDADGDLFVTGRVDDMIISGGENISPVEIESTLSLHPGVLEVAVVGLPDPRWGQRVTAFVKRAPQDQSTSGPVSKDRRSSGRGAGGEFDAERVGVAELDHFCRASSLADFKRPRDYIFVVEIPKSPVGKILRRLLVAGDYAREDSKQ